MSRQSFADALKQFKQAWPLSDEVSLYTVERLERQILDHVPETCLEAVGMLDVVILNILPGVRCDGRDLKALASIRAMLMTESASNVRRHDSRRAAALKEQSS